MITFQGAVFGVVAILFVVPLFTNKARDTEQVDFGGFFNFYEMLDITRDRFAWRFLYAVYIIPIAAITIMVSVQHNFELWELDTFLLLTTVSGFILGATARLQAVFIERDSFVDIFLYYGILVYLLMYAIPPSWFDSLYFSPDLSGRTGAEFYMPILLSSVSLFVITLFAFGLYVYRRREKL